MNLESLGRQANSIIQSHIDELLQQFVTAVGDYQKGEQPREDLHAMRVASRRLEAGLELCRAYLRPRRQKELLSLVARLRDFSNPVRDLDVHLLWIKKNERDRKAKEKLKKKRERFGKVLQDFVDQELTTKKLKSYCNKIHRIPAENSFAMLAVELLESLSSFSSAYYYEPWNQHRLHRWRIAGKRLRYQLEFIQALDLTPQANDPVPMLAQLQEKLGAQCDHSNREMKQGEHCEESSLTAKQIRSDAEGQMHTICRSVLAVIDTLLI